MSLIYRPAKESCNFLIVVETSVREEANELRIGLPEIKVVPDE